MRKNGARGAYRRQDVQVENVEPVVVGEILEGGKGADASRVVHQHVDRAKTLHGFLDHAEIVLGLGRVGGNGDHFSFGCRADLARRFLQFFSPARGDGDL